jgi:hypothetical protein
MKKIDSYFIFSQLSFTAADIATSADKARPFAA